MFDYFSVPFDTLSDHDHFGRIFYGFFVLVVAEVDVGEDFDARFFLNIRVIKHSLNISQTVAIINLFILRIILFSTLFKTHFLRRLYFSHVFSDLAFTYLLISL